MRTFEFSGIIYDMISVLDYFQDRETQYAPYFTKVIEENASELLRRVNGLLSDLRVDTAKIKINSGWRPPPVNAVAGGVPHSLHVSAKAIDIKDDEDSSLAVQISAHPQLLEKWQLWLESPAKTHGWVHLDMGERRQREIRIFFP